MSDERRRVPRARDLPLDTVDELPERVDVVVVGGGIAGASVLYHLAAGGVDALLLERERVGGGATGAAVGVLSPPLRQPFHETVRDRGLDEARAIWSFALRSTERLTEVLEGMSDAVAAELDVGGGHVLAEPYTAHEVEHSFEALERAGFPVRWMESAEVRERTGGRGFSGGFVIPGGGALNAPATARLLVRAAVGAGARAAEATGLQDVERDGGGLVCRTPGGKVRCTMVIYAVHTDARRFSALLGDEIVPIRGQAMAAEIVSGSVPEGSWATHWKMNLWRRSPSGRLLLGGWRHEAWDRSYWKMRPEVDPVLQEGLLAWFRQAFPRVRLEVSRQWSGIFGWTADHLPLVGPLPGVADELVVAGFSGGGLPLAFECGRVAADIVRGVDPADEAELFAPRRFAT